MQHILTFYIYSFLGWITECIYCSIPAHKFINRGFLAGPYCPIYGCGAMLVISLLTPFSYSPPLLFVMGLLITSSLEYFTSYLMEVCFHTKWWDYSTYRYNLHGRICLKNSLMFAILVLIVYYLIQPSIVHVIEALPLLLQACITGCLTILFLFDIYNTTIALLHKNKAFMEIEKSVHTLYEDFSIQGLRNDMHELIQHKILDNTTIDEQILKHIHHFKEQMERIHSHRTKTHQRLHKAFPTMKEALEKRNAEAFFTYFNESKKKEK